MKRHIAPLQKRKTHTTFQSESLGDLGTDRRIALEWNLGIRSEDAGWIHLVHDWSSDMLLSTK
jgi:hypothetical protein